VFDDACKYLGAVLSKTKYDVAVAVERRGLAVFREAYRRRISKSFPNLVVLSNEAIHCKDFTGKVILLFDDVLNTGGTIRRILVELRRTASRVDVAVLAKRSGSRFPTLPPLYRLEKRSYREYSYAVSRYIASLLVPSDAHHILVLGKLVPALSSERLKLTLKTLGRFYDRSDDGTSVSRFGVTEPRFADLKRKSWAKSMPVPQFKIRVNYRHRSESGGKKGEVCVFPIAYQESDANGRDRPPGHSVGYCFCRRDRNSPWLRDAISRIGLMRGESEDFLREWFLYQKCILFNLSCYLLESFMKKWRVELRRSRCKFVFDHVEYQRTEEMIQDPSILKYLTRLVTRTERRRS
jgi:hypothetical protein